jgi:hypothetical protein
MLSDSKKSKTTTFGGFLGHTGGDDVNSVPTVTVHSIAATTHILPAILHTVDIVDFVKTKERRFPKRARMLDCVHRANGSMLTRSYHDAGVAAKTAHVMASTTSGRRNDGSEASRSLMTYAELDAALAHARREHDHWVSYAWERGQLQWLPNYVDIERMVKERQQEWAEFIVALNVLLHVGGLYVATDAGCPDNFDVLYERARADIVERRFECVLFGDERDRGAARVEATAMFCAPNSAAVAHLVLHANLAIAAQHTPASFLQFEFDHAAAMLRVAVQPTSAHTWLVPMYADEVAPANVLQARAQRELREHVARVGLLDVVSVPAHVIAPALRHTRARSFIVRLSSDEQALLHAFMRRVFGVLRQLNITIGLQAGSVIGALRHGELTPWDDDIDVFIKTADLHVLLSQRALLEREGFAVAEFGSKEGHFNHKIYPLETFAPNMPAKKHRLPWRWPFFDLFTVDLVPELGVVRMRKPGGEARDVPVHWVFPLRPVLYFDLLCWIPRRAEQLQNLVYGNNWMQSCLCPRSLLVYVCACACVMCARSAGTITGGSQSISTATVSRSRVTRCRACSSRRSRRS